jgi:hypothetical protein
MRFAPLHLLILRLKIVHVMPYGYRCDGFLDSFLLVAYLVNVFYKYGETPLMAARQSELQSLVPRGPR